MVILLVWPAGDYLLGGVARAYSRGHSTLSLSPNSILENGCALAVSSNIIWCLYFEANYQLLPWVTACGFFPLQS